MLEVAGLHKRYGATVALDGASFTVRAGEMFGFVGANGAGKTSTMRIIMGVLAPDAGHVTWQGRRLNLTLRRQFGYMPEERGLYARMRVREQVMYFGRLRGLSTRQARHAADKWLAELGLAERSNDEVGALSLGNQQRVQLAVALVHDPHLLVLDEPFSGLDPLAVDLLADVLAQRCAAGVPVIFSSHQLELVERLCDSVGIISAGRIVATGAVDELRNSHGQTVALVVEGAAAGWQDTLPGQVISPADGDRVLVRTEDDQAVLQAAMRAGRVVEFKPHQPSLTEIFREAVA